jgi:hypothetical protein
MNNKTINLLIIAIIQSFLVGSNWILVIMGLASLNYILIFQIISVICYLVLAFQWYNIIIDGKYICPAGVLTLVLIQFMVILVLNMFVSSVLLNLTIALLMQLMISTMSIGISKYIKHS